MIKLFQTLRFRLFFWYILSLLFLGFFIILTVHIYQYKYSAYILALIFLILSVIGFWIIDTFTKSLTFLSRKMRSISSKNLEERITTIKSQDEIGRLALTFNDLLDRLGQAFKRERQFIADVAHEMKTPISTLKSSFEVTLQKARVNEEYKKILQDSIAEIDRLTSTLKNVLDLAWTEVPSESQKETFDLSALLEELIEISQKLAQKKQITVSHSIASGIKMRGFRDRLGNAILNIIDNAIKYTPYVGKVSATLIKEQNNALITIKDTGSGIEESELLHIFDRFYRGSKASKVFGAGLGLAIAKATIAIHKGVIKVESKPKVGTTFLIAIPLS